MRTIKFRVWNSDDNKMEYPIVFAMSDGKLKPLIKCADGNSAYKDYPIMQFTGLQDKNSVDIYEGDIVKSNKKFYSAELAEVRWMDKRCSFYFIAKTCGTDIINRNPFESAFKTNSLKVEVVGNIHDNPGLLTKN